MMEATGRDAVLVVDMACGDANAVAQGVACAAWEWGGFLLVGHVVPAGAMDRTQEHIARLFTRPAPEKTRAWWRPGEGSGYGVGSYSLNFDRQMWSEGYTFPAADVRGELRRVWPDAGDEYIRFCEVMEEYHREMRILGGQLLDVFFRALGLTTDQIAGGETERKIRETLTTTMRVNLYPKCPDPERAIGLAAHTDSSFFTLITQSPVPGLKLLRREPDRWVTVPALPGAFAVVLGDMFQVLTNGPFCSLLHHAIVNSESDRISGPYFLGPSADVEMAPLVASVVMPGARASFRAVTWPEYMAVRKKTFETDASALAVGCGGGRGRVASSELADEIRKSE